MSSRIHNHILCRNAGDITGPALETVGGEMCVACEGTQGTGVVTLQGSWDNVDWTTLESALSVGSIQPVAQANVYTFAPYIRVKITGSTGGESITVVVLERR